MRVILRANGAMEMVFHALNVDEIEREIGADCLDTVSLLHGVVMLCDDVGHKKGLALNEAATQLYWSKCGGQVDHYIVGDVYLCPDDDFRG
jgi:hypothetical protein